MTMMSEERTSVESCGGRERKEVKVLDVMSSHLWADGELSSKAAHFQQQYMKAGGALLSCNTFPVLKTVVPGSKTEAEA